MAEITCLGKIFRPWTLALELRREKLLHQRFLGVGAFGDQNASIRGAPVKWQKKPKKQVDEKIHDSERKAQQTQRSIDGNI